MATINASITVGGVSYGPVIDSRGPVGGGLGYDQSLIYTSGDYTVTTADELIAAVAAATTGEVIYVPEGEIIDMTPEVNLNGSSLALAAGVTLASNRGYPTGSVGGAIICNELDTFALIRPTGANVRITGLRINGPMPYRMSDWHGNPSWGSLPVSRGIWSDDAGLEVDNCELTGWAHVAVYLYRNAINANIHHNYIHHCQYEGLGYGVGMSGGATPDAAANALVEFCLFDYTRHSITGSGRAENSFTARHNIQLRNCISHAFDMHESPDDPGLGGDFTILQNNYFENVTVLGTPYFGFKQRGVPSNTTGTSLIELNWFPLHDDVSTAVEDLGGVTVTNNQYSTSISALTIPEATWRDGMTDQNLQP